MSGRPQPGDPDFPYMLADTPEEFERVRRAAWPAPSPAAALPDEDVERVARRLRQIQCHGAAAVLSPAAAGLLEEDVERVARAIQDASAREGVVLVGYEIRSPMTAAGPLGLESARRLAGAALANQRPTAAVPDPRFREQLAEAHEHDDSDPVDPASVLREAIEELDRLGDEHGQQPDALNRVIDGFRRWATGRADALTVRRPCPYGCEGGHTEYEYGDQHRNPEGGH